MAEAFLDNLQHNLKNRTRRARTTKRRDSDTEYKPNDTRDSSVDDDDNDNLILRKRKAKSENDQPVKRTTMYSEKDLRKELLKAMPAAKDLPSKIYCRKCGSSMRLAKRKVGTSEKVVIVYRCPQRQCQTFKSPRMILRLLTGYDEKAEKKKKKQEDMRIPKDIQEESQNGRKNENRTSKRKITVNSNEPPTKRRSKINEDGADKETIRCKGDVVVHHCLYTDSSDDLRNCDQLSPMSIKEELQNSTEAGHDHLNVVGQRSLGSKRILMPDVSESGEKKQVPTIRRSMRLMEAPRRTWNFVGSDDDDETEAENEVTNFAEQKRSFSHIPRRISNRKVTVNPGALESQVFNSCLTDGFEDQLQLVYGAMAMGDENCDDNENNGGDIDDITENVEGEGSYIIVGNNKICIDWICSLVDSAEDAEPEMTLFKSVKREIKDEVDGIDAFVGSRSGAEHN